MATKCGRFISRASLSSLRSTVNLTLRSSSAVGSNAYYPLPIRSASSPLRRFSFSRTPSELGCAMSLLPLHTAVSSARMTSCLSTSSRSCRALSQDKIDGT